MEPNAFDLSILLWLNQYAQSSAQFNHLMHHISLNNAFKGFPLMLVFWYLWFSEKPDAARNRRILMMTLMGAFVAMALALIINIGMPFKQRPYVNAELGLTPLLGIPDKVHAGLFFVSTFPSDTSALFFAIATGIFFLSKRLGIVALLYTLGVIAFPRVYLRLHYPTDVIAGALIGCLSVIACRWADTRLHFTNYFDRLICRAPAATHALLFFISYQIIDLFYTLRLVAAALFKLI